MNGGMKATPSVQAKHASRQPAALVTLLGIVAVLTFAGVYCGSSDCPPPGFDQGELFRLTITGRDPDNPMPCGILDLAGDTAFVLTAATCRHPMSKAANTDWAHRGP